jgi:phosphatidylethanolamine/phosphatidyl-N-methylethanolamine N-methyltransferase
MICFINHISMIVLMGVLSAWSQEKFMFAGQFANDPLAIGAIVPSSEELSEMMTETVESDHSIVIELGAGTGPFTEKLVNKVPKDKLYVLENNVAFYEHLCRRFPGQNILCADACELEKHIPVHLHGKINVVVSGLPFRSLPPEVAAKILSSLRKVCAPNFKLIQFTYFNEPPLPINAAEALGVVPTYYKLASNNIPAAHVWLYKPMISADQDK